MKIIEFSNEQKDTYKRNDDNILKFFPIPPSQKRLYGVEGLFHCVLFNTQEELYKWMENHELEEGVEMTLDYVGDFAGYSDVLVVSYGEEFTDIISSSGENAYCLFDSYSSAQLKIPIWLTHYGSSVIEDMYSALKRSGITLENDIYAKKHPQLVLVANNRNQSKD